jgi:hypothetical protein
MHTTGSTETPLRRKNQMLLICLFFGALGIHRYMMGYKNWWLMAITLGGCGTWQIIDLILLLNGGLKMADGRELEK